MPDLGISASDAHEYAVTVTADDGTQTAHTVRVPPAMLADLGLSDAQEPTLVRASLLYLLEREPASSILTDFSLDDIGRYFPDYPADIRAWV